MSHSPEKTKVFFREGSPEHLAASRGLPFVPSQPASTPWGAAAPPSASDSPHGFTQDPKLHPQSQRPAYAEPGRSESPRPLYAVQEPVAHARVEHERNAAEKARASTSPRPLDIAQVGSARAASDAALLRDAHTKRKRDARGFEAPLVRRAIVDVFGFDPDLPRRLRRERRYGEMLRGLGKLRRAVPLDGVEPASEQDANDVTRVMSVAPPDSLAAMRGAHDRAPLELESFDIPLLVVEGSLRPSFDPLQSLRVLTSLAQPFVGGDKRVAHAVSVAETALAAATPVSGRALQRTTAQLEQATAALNLPPQFFSESLERTLLEERKYLFRTLYGERRIRCELESEGLTLPVYLREDVATKLPLLFSFPVLLIAELRPREDIAETHQEALLALAVARQVRTS